MDSKNLFKSRLLSRYEPNCYDTTHPKCLFYIWETKCICALDTPYRKGDSLESAPGVHQTEIEASKDEKTQVAWGYPAFLLANWRNIPCENKKDSYNNFIEYLHATNNDRIEYEEIMKDWRRTLVTLFESSHKTDLHSFYEVGRRIKMLFFAHAKDFSLETEIFKCESRILIVGSNRPYYAYLIPACEPAGDSLFPQLVLVPEYDTITSLQAARKNTWAAYGYIATLIQYSICAYIDEVWKNMDFVRIHEVNYWIRQLKEFKLPCVTPSKIDFKLPFSYVDLMKKYLNESVDYIRECISTNPMYPPELSEGNNIYSYIFWAEKTAFQVFVANQLYASFTREQQDQLQTFFRRYLEYLSKTYGANEEFMNRINMREYGHIEPLQISLTTHVQVTDKDGKDVTLERARTDGWVVPETETPNKKKNAKIYHSFASSIQNVDAEKFLTYLHKKIDGNGGKEVACILGAAIYKYHYLSKVPSEKEFMAEFPKISSTFKAIKHQLNMRNEQGTDSFTRAFMLIDISL